MEPVKNKQITFNIFRTGKTKLSLKLNMGGKEMGNTGINGIDAASIDENQLNILLQAEKNINSSNKNLKDIYLIAVTKKS
jgi:hypothetical protein